jgi:hypothetical protein
LERPQLVQAAFEAALSTQVRSLRLVDVFDLAYCVQRRVGRQAPHPARTERAELNVEHFADGDAPMVVDAGPIRGTPHNGLRALTHRISLAGAAAASNGPIALHEHRAPHNATLATIANALPGGSGVVVLLLGLANDSKPTNAEAREIAHGPAATGTSLSSAQVVRAHVSSRPTAQADG